MDGQNDADSDAFCADEDICPADPENDHDGDSQCAADDSCPYDAMNDADSDAICVQGKCYDSLSLNVAGHGSCATYAPGRSNHGHCETDDVCGMCACSCSVECRLNDPCPDDTENDADGDGTCGNEEDCPHDAENDADADAVCGEFQRCAVLWRDFGTFLRDLIR